MRNINFIRRGSGAPLLLVHGLGGSTESWSPILNSLAREREVIAVDLPGFGESPPLESRVSVKTLANALTEFISENGLLGIDAVGGSVGARILLELVARQNVVGAVVALSPGGFWRGLERHVFFGSAFASIRMIRALQPFMHDIVRSKTGRTALLAQFSAHPSKLPPDVVLKEMRSFAKAVSFDELLQSFAFESDNQKIPFGTIRSSFIIGWGRNDRICLPHEAKRAVEYFPDAKLRWIKNCGHYPQWDSPEETVQLILDNTGPELRHSSRPFKHALVNGQIAERARSGPFDSPAL